MPSISDRAFRLAALVSILIGIGVLAYLGVLDKAATGGAVVLLIMAVVQVFRSSEEKPQPQPQPEIDVRKTQPSISDNQIESKGPDGK